MLVTCHCGRCARTIEKQQNLLPIRVLADENLFIGFNVGILY